MIWQSLNLKVLMVKLKTSEFPKISHIRLPSGSLSMGHISNLNYMNDLTSPCISSLIEMCRDVSRCSWHLSSVCKWYLCFTEAKHFSTPSCTMMTANRGVATLVNESNTNRVQNAVLTVHWSFYGNHIYCMSSYCDKESFLTENKAKLISKEERNTIKTE